MKTILLLIVLGVAGYFGYQYFVAAPEVDETAAQDGEATSAAEASEAPMTSEQAFSELAADPASGSSGGLPAAAASAIEAADQRWDAIAAEGADPTRHNEAVALARQYSQALFATYADDALRPVAEQLIRERLNPLAEQIFFSSTRYPEDPTGLIDSYTVTSGNLLTTIAKPFGIDFQLINMMRGRDLFNDALREGETLKVLKVTGQHPAKDYTEGFYYHVDKSDFRLDVYVMGVFIKRFPVGIGTDTTPTPIGQTFIEARERNPGQWTMPDGTVVMPGDPRFIIGEYWLRLNPQIGAAGIGFHTYTGEGPTTGAKVSNGCIRLEPDDMELLYALSTPVGHYPSGFITRSPMTVEIVE